MIELADIAGKLPDTDVARLCKTTIYNIRKYRIEHGIPRPKGKPVEYVDTDVLETLMKTSHKLWAGARSSLRRVMLESTDTLPGTYFEISDGVEAHEKSLTVYTENNGLITGSMSGMERLAHEILEIVEDNRKGK